jgi:hypothetical protein
MRGSSGAVLAGNIGDGSFSFANTTEEMQDMRQEDAT